MSNRSTAATALVTLALAWASDAGAQSNPPTSRWVELGKPHLAKRGNAIVLVQSITSTASKDRFWALVEVNGADDSGHATG